MNEENVVQNGFNMLQGLKNFYAEESVKYYFLFQFRN